MVRTKKVRRARKPKFRHGTLVTIVKGKLKGRIGKVEKVSLGKRLTWKGAKPNVRYYWVYTRNFKRGTWGLTWVPESQLRKASKEEVKRVRGRL